MPAFEPVSSDFDDKWETNLFQAEQNLVQLLLLEPGKVIAKTKLGIESNLKEKHQIDFPRERSALED